MKLAILLPTLPAYRKDFFERLDEELSKNEVSLTVLHGTQFLKKSVKSDVNPKYRAFPVKTSEFNIAGYRIVWWTGILKKIRTLKPDGIVILFSPGNISLWLVQIFCYISKIKVGIWSCGFTRMEVTGIRRKFRGFLLNYFLFHAKFHICYGTNYKNSLLEMGIDSSKIFVAQNTLNVEDILKIEISDRNKKNSPTVSFLFVGALIREKNLDKAIRAFARLVRDGFDLILNIVGQGSIIKDLQTIVLEEGMESKIFITGPKYGNELTSYFLNADIFIMPGTGGLAVNEAMAYGLPVLSTIGDGTVTDLLVEGENGYYLNEKASVDDIYSKCRFAMTRERALLQKMGQRSREIIIEKATLQNMVSGFKSAIIKGMN
jgi:glycosyltransferase involved in cell wall biosynthesis